MYLKGIKDAKSLGDIAYLLGFSPAGLAYILYKIPNNKKYYSFQIKKKNGGVRDILAPEPSLKKLQRRLANFLYSCSFEIDMEKNKQPLAHGFKKNLSIYTNAKCHKNRRFVLNFDIEDFFPTINFGRVRGFFIKNRDFELDKKIATIIAQIACHDNQLPQGSPCSPIISNFIAHLLDVRLVQLAKKNGCFYSRYADDITFSSNKKDFPKEIGFQDPKNPEVWHLGKAIKEQVDRSGFKINPQKTNMRCLNNRQVVTGLVVNKKVNIRSEYYKLARAMTHSLFQKGSYKVPANYSPIDIADNDSEEVPEKSLNRLEGILNHIHYTKNQSDKRLWKEKHDHPTTILKLYKEFLFFKHFGWSERPVVLCEGVSDRVYIRLALKKLKDSYPSLIELDEEKLYYKINFLRYSRSVKNILKLSGGTGEMAGFVGSYPKKVASYRAWSFKQPVIVLTDNDAGARTVFNQVKDSPQGKPKVENDEEFYYINNNLYLIKTPHLNGDRETIIEDLFDQKWKNEKIDGKSFTLDNDFDKNKFYGKMDFAEKIIAKNFNEVDFDSFKSIFDRILAVINYHSKLKISST